MINQEKYDELAAMLSPEDQPIFEELVTALEKAIGGGETDIEAVLEQKGISVGSPVAIAFYHYALDLILGSLRL